MAKFEQGTAPAIRIKYKGDKRITVWNFVKRHLVTNNEEIFEELVAAGAVRLDKTGAAPAFEFPFDPEALTKDELAALMLNDYKVEISVHQTREDMLEDIEKALTGK